MGWTQHPDTQYTREQIKRELTAICAPWIPLQMSQVGSTWYVAAQHGDQITAFVVLTSTKGGWAYKDMDENCGPNEAKAPMSLIKKLTGPDKSGWRARCIQHAHRPKFKVGDKLRLKSAVSNETDFTVTTYESRGKTRRCFHNPKIGLCRLGAYSLQGATKL